MENSFKRFLSLALAFLMVLSNVPVQAFATDGVVTECAEHSYGITVIETEATCTTAGSQHLVCSVCYVETESEEIPMLDHSYTDGVCSVCGAEDPDYVAPAPLTVEEETPVEDEETSAEDEVTSEDDTVSDEVIVSSDEVDVLSNSGDETSNPDEDIATAGTSFTVTIVANGGTVTDAEGNEVTTITVENGSFDVATLAATKDGHKFVNWFDNPEFSGYPATTCTKETTLYAKWETNAVDTQAELESALNAGGTVTLECDIDLHKDVTLYSGSVVLDLNGHTISATGTNGIDVYGGALTIKDGKGGGKIVSTYAKCIDRQRGTVTLEGLEEVESNGIWTVQKKAEDTTIDTEDELKAALAAGGEVVLGGDIVVTNTLTISEDVKVTLDLAGYTISQTKEQTAGYQMILNDGNLTIEDSVDGGKISYTDSGNGGEYISDTIYNRGTLVINGGTIENLSSATVAKNGYPHAVDTYSGIRDTSVTIDGEHVVISCANYSAIRMFCVSAEYKADLVIENGTIKGAIDMQNGTKDAALGSLTINGGKFDKNESKGNIRFANWNGGATEYGISAEITDGEFDSGIVTTYVPAAANWDSKIISGGTFGEDVSAYVADGYEYDTATGKVSVKTEEPEVPEVPEVTIEKPESVTEEQVNAVVSGIQNQIDVSAAENVPSGMTLVIQLTKTSVDASVVPTKLVFNVAPMKGNEKQSDAGRVITFRLPIPANWNKTHAKITHDNVEMGIVEIKGENGAQYVEVSSQTFSEFTVEPVDAPVADYVAKIGDTKYTTLQAALDAAEAGNTITLCTDLQTVDVTISKNVTIDLGGKTITDAYIKTAADVTIQNGSIKNVEESYPLVVNSGALTIENVAIEASKSDRAIWLRNSGATLNFNSGSILATKGENNTKSTIYGVWVSEGATANINGGSITVDAGADATAVAIFGNYVNTVNVTGGKISTSGKNYSYAIYTYGDVTVSGGEIVTNEKQYCYSNGITYGKNYAINTKGDVEISGGKITTNGSGGYLVNAGGSNQEVTISNVEFTNVLTEADKTAGGHSAPNLIYGSSVTAAITGGDFTGVSAQLIKGTDSTLTVSGGTFDVAIAEDYLAEGFAPVDNGDGTYGVKASPKGNDFTGYTRSDAIWGEVWGNASESFVIKVLDASGNVMGTTSLNNVNGIIDGDLTVTWNLKLDAASNTDEYWTMSWTTAPTLDNQPAKVELWVDDVKVSGGDVVLNGPDSINMINAAVADADGKILSYQKTLADAVAAAENGATIAILRAGDYTLPEFANKELTFVGVDKENTSITDWVNKGSQGMMGSTVHFKNLTIKGQTENYYGLFHTAGVTYENCNINGLRFLYATSVSFEDCAFNAQGVEHSFWTYGASNVTVTNCTFTYTDRAVNCYSENGADHELDIAFNDCTFTYAGTAAEPEGAVEINSGSVKSIELTMDDCTAPEKGEMWFNSQWDSQKGANTVVTVDGNVVWKPLKGTGTAEDPYLISSVDDLLTFQKKVDEQAQDGSTQFAGKYFKLTADLDLAGINWNPIGSMSGDHGSFKGIFDGDGHTIYNLNVQQDGDGLGLFARTAGNAEIKNLTLNNVTVKSTNNSNYVGGLVGNSYASTKITNVHVTGNIDISGRGYIGGISGHGYVVMDNVSVKGTGTISSTFWCAGGILGYGGEGATNIMNAHVEGITITSAAGGLGAIVGMAEDNNGTQPISGSNLSAKNVEIKTYTGAYGDSYANYALGYLYGGNPTSKLTGELSVENVKVETSSGVAPEVNDAVATIGDKVYFDLQTAVNAGGEVKVLRDIVLSDTVTVPAGKTVTLNLNGKTISQEKACTASYEMIANNGTLTITGNGKLSFKDTGAGDPTAGWGSYTIRNSGTLVVENGTIEHLGEQNQAGQAFAHTTLAIFQYSGSTTINGGTISTPNYRSVRLWSGDMTINGGVMDGQVWVHCVNDTSKLTITGGEFSPNGNDGSSVFVNNSGYKSELSVTGGTFETKIGANDPAALNGPITGGTFTEAAMNGTNAALLNKNSKFQQNSDGTYGIVAKVYVVKIGDEGYESLQEAVNAAKNGETVTLLADSSENITVTQAPDVAITIDGAGKTMSGSITVDGKSAAYATAGLTIKNVNFVAASDATCIHLGVSGNNNTRYTSNVTVESCTFTGTDKTAAGIKSYTGGDKNLTIKNCTATGMHSLLQVKNVAGLTVTGGSITDSKNGISVGNSSKVVVDGTKIDATGYGVRADGNVASDITVRNATISAADPIVVRKATAAGYKLDVTGNTLTASNENGYVVTFTTGDDGSYEAPSVKLDITGTDSKKVFPVYVANIGDTYYTDITEAFKAATSGCTIEILSDVTVSDTWDCRDYATNGSHSQFKEAVTINGNGKTIKFTGTINDNNWNTVFRFEENATVQNLTIDISEATGAQRVITAKKSLTVDKLTIIGDAKYGIIFGEGSSAADLAAAEIVIKNSDLTGTRRAISDNEGGKDVKSIVITDNTLKANVYVSASEAVSFTGNTVQNGYVDIRSYSAENVLAVTATGNTLTANTETKYNYIYAKTIDAQEEFEVKHPPFKVSTKAELNAALSAAQEGDTILLTADIDYGTDQLKIEKAITLDLGGNTLTTRNAYGGMSVKGNPTIKNGTIVHASNTAAIKVWNAAVFEDLVIDVQGKGDANKTIGGIVLQSGTTTRVGSIENVTIKGDALTNGIETYNCGDATENVIGSMENVTIDAKGTGMLISAPCGTATNCSISGDVNAIEIWIKGTYSASLDLVNSKVEGGVFAHDEFSSNPDIVNNGTLKLTVDDATTGVEEDDITLTLARAEENVEGILEDIIANAQAKVNGTYYASLLDALKAAEDGETVTMLKDVELYTRLIFSLYTAGRDVTLDGNGHKLFASSTNWGTGNGKHLINVNCDNVTLKDLVLDCNKIAEGVNIYKAQHIVFDNVTIINKKGYNADLTVNGSTLTVKNKLSASYVDVDLGSGVTTDLGIVAAEGAVLDVRTLQMDTAAYPNTDLDKALSTDGTSYYSLKKLDANGNLAGYSNSMSRLSNGYGYKMLEDMTVNANVTLLNAGHTGTLDTNGHTLTIADGKALTVNGDLTVVGEGTIAGKIILGKEATLTAPNGLNVETVDGYVLVYSNGAYVSTEVVATIGNVPYTTLDAAFAAAQPGDEVKIMKAGTYALTVSGKDITITGAVNGVVFDNIGAKNMGSANVTFNNVTFDYYPNVNYTGLQHSGNLVYNNCTINGQVFLYGQSETFNKCTFNQNSADAYNVWTYGAKEVAFNECTFNSAGKSVLIYSEQSDLVNDVTVTKSTFNATSAVDGKAAIEMDSSLTSGINLTIDEATTATGFGSGNVSGNSLWNNKKGSNTDANNDITVVVNNETVLAPVTFVAKIGEIGYTTIKAALDAAKAGDTVNIFAGEYTESVSVNKAITVVGETDENGNNLVKINGGINITADGATVKNLTASNPSTAGYNCTLTINAKDVLVEGCEITDANAMRYSETTGNVTLKDCVLTATDTWAIHFDGSTVGNVTVDGCEVNGWIAFAGNLEKVTLKDSTFTMGNWSGGRTYNDDVVISGCIFETGYKFDLPESGANVVVTNSQMSDGSSVVALFKSEDACGKNTITIDEKPLKYVAKIGNDYYETLEEALADVGEWTTIKLVADATLDYGAREAYGQNNTTDIIIDGQGHTLTLNQKNSDWSSIGIANANGKLTLKNMTIEKTGYGDTSGAWNTHAIIFSCNVEMNKVTVNNGIAVQNGATLTDVTINEAGDYYGLWINGNGQAVTVNGGAINATKGRGIKIADQYIDAPESVTLSVTGTEFNTAKKAAVLVSSVAGADITATNVNITNVAADSTNVAWVDEDWGAHYNKVTVNDAPAAQENKDAFVAAFYDENNAVIGYYKTLQKAVDEAQPGSTVTVIKNVTLTESLVIPAAATTFSTRAATGITLDLAGNTVSMEDSSGEGCYMVKNESILTILDSSEAKTGKLTLHSTTPSADNGYSVSTIGNGGTLIIESGTIENTTDGGACYAIDNLNYSRDVSLTINGGKIVGKRIAIRQQLNTGSTTAKNVLNITGGEIEGATGAVQTHNYNNAPYLADVNISGGTLTGTYAYYTTYSYNNTHTGTDVEITGGTFNGHVFIYNGKSGSSAEDFANVAIKGGSFMADFYAYTKDAEGNEVAIPAITGGTFAEMQAEAYLAAGYALKYDAASRMFNVVDAMVASVNGVEYNDLTKAIEAATALNGATIYLKRNVTLKETLEIVSGSRFTLDMMTYTLNGSILAPSAEITIQNGSIKNTDSSVSAIEINAGKLTLTNVNIESARHALRVDGAVEATINSGKFTLIGSGLTQHALNVSKGAKVTINGGTFVGAKGTGADSGAAVNVQTGATVSIIGGDFSGGMNNTLASKGTLTVTGGTYDQDPSAFVAEHYKAVKNAEGKYEVVKKVYTMEIVGGMKYETFAEALDAVQAGQTIKILDGAKGDETKTEIEFTKDIEFTITGKNAEYALPVITFQNATVTIKDAEILIPELDARQNATINVIDSIVHDAGGNGIVKSYYNGAINISGTSVVHTMQVTTMGYITVSDTAKLNATWQTNVYGNGIITVKDDATFATAALHLTGQDYSGRDNTDTDRVGKPAAIVVDGADLIIGKVYSDNGADYSYNSSKGINIGTVDGKSAVLDIKNGATVAVYMANGETANIGANGTVNVDASALTVACRAADGKATLANKGTINVSGTSDIAANVTGAGWVYMNGVTLDADTKLLGAKVRFASGTNNVIGSVIDDGFFQVGIGAYQGVDANVDTANGVTVNVKNATIGSSGSTYAGWIGTGFYETDADKATVMTDAKYVLNIENSVAAFGYMHVSNDGELNVMGNAAEKVWYNNSDYSFYAGNLIVNGTATFDATDVLALYTTVSCDNGTKKPGTVNIVGGTEYEAERHNGAIGGTNFDLRKTAVVNVGEAKLYIGEYTSIAANAVLNVGGEVTALGTITNNGTIKLTAVNASITTPEAPEVVSGLKDYNVTYADGAYKLTEKTYVAQIGEVKYESLAEALTAAKDGETIELIWTEGNDPIAMNGAIYGKSVTITGTATVDWNKGFLFIGRGGEGNGTVIFDNANLTSASNSGSYGIHVSGREKDTTEKYDGTLVIKNSTIVLDYLISKNIITLDNATLTVKNGFSIGGRLADETESGVDATATLSLTNGSKLIVNNHNGMGLGTEGNKVGVGVMNIDKTSSFETTQSFLVTAKGTMNLAGTAKIAGTLTNNGSIVLKDAAATLTSSECGNVTTDVKDYEVVYAVDAYKLVADIGADIIGGLKPVSDNTRVSVTTTLEDVYAQNELYVELWSGNTKLSTTSWKKTYPVSMSELTVSIVLKGESSSWNTEWHVKPTVGNIPDTIKVYVDGNLADTFTKTGNAFQYTTDLEKYIALDEVYKAAKIGDVLYASLAEAIAAAQAGDTIVLLNNIDEDVTVNKNLTIDGANGETKFNYTGKMTISKSINLTVQNVNFVEGNIVKGKNTGASGTYTIKNCDFSSEKQEVYAVELRGTTSIVIEDCTSSGYYGFLQVPSSNNSVSLKDVTIMKSGYAVKVDYSNGVTLENVKISESTYGFVNSNFGEKTITVKDCTITADYPLVIWDRNTTNVNTFKFEGTNDFGSKAFYYNKVTEEEMAYTKYVLATADATLKAVADLDVTSGVTGYNAFYKDDKYYLAKPVAQIGEVQYETFAEALDAVQDGETIIILEGATGNAELKKEIEFTKDIEFTITGKNAEYALPVITFKNATVNIKDAEILIPELDARQNATINVIDSIVHDAGGNGIVKSYYNGAINISGTSVVHTMQVTTMGYITVSDTAKLNATWQTNVYGNGMITVKDDATFATAALHLTGQDYSGRDNTDADRVGKPAAIVVDGADLIIGKVYSDNGADYSYNSSKGINIGTVDGKSAVLDIKNGAKVNVYMANGETANIGANGTVNVNGTVTVACRAENGNATLINNGSIVLNSVNSTVTANECGKVTTDVADYKVIYVDGTYKLAAKTYVAQIGEVKYESLQEAVEAAADGAIITVTADHELTWDGTTVVDNTYAAYVKVAGKAVTIDLNGKKLTGNTDEMEGMLIAAFAADDGGSLTLIDSSEPSTGSVEVTGAANAYCLLMAYENGTKLTVNGGNYYLENAQDSLIYSGGYAHLVTINGGTFTLGNVGTGENGKPWIINVLSQNANYVLVNGGTFNADISHQFWANEVSVPETKALKSNGDSTWTVVDAVAYVIERGTSTNSYDRKIGYATLGEAIASAQAVKDVTVLKNVELTQDWTAANITVNKDATFTVAADKTLSINSTMAVNGTLVNNGTVNLAKVDATVTAAEGLTIITNISEHKVVYADGVYKVIAKDYKVQIGETKYETLTEAIAAAQAGDTIVLLDNINENVTVNKNLTIDGKGETGNYNYTGKITANKVNLTVQNVNFVKGQIYKHKSTGVGGNFTITNCTFDGQGLADYAVNLGGTGAIVIENVNANGYGYGFLQVPASNNTISLKAVTISNVNYGLKIDYSNEVALENVTIQNAAVAGVLDSNFGSKTYTVKGCELSSIDIWERAAAKTSTFKFEGENTVGTLFDSQYAKYFLAAVDATVKAPEGAAVSTEIADHKVVFENGIYKVIAKVYVAQVNDGAKFETLAEAIAAANAGDTVTLLADITGDVTVNKSLTIDGANHKYNATIYVEGNNANVTIKNVNFENGTYYAVKTDRINSVTIEDCTVKNYAWGFLYANKSTPTITVKNVTVDGGSYGMHWAYGAKATLENVVMKNVTYGIMTQNYGAKTITLKNCSIDATNAINVWKRSATVIDTFKFEGLNVINGSVPTDTNIDVKAAAQNETILAGKRFTLIGDLQPVIKGVSDGATITVLEDIDLTNAELSVLDGKFNTYFLVEGKSVIVDMNGMTISGNYAATDKLLVGVFSTDNNGHLTLTGNGTVDVKATGETQKYTSNVYSLIATYEDGCSINIKNGTYKLNKAHDCLIYSGCTEGVIIEDGTYRLGNVDSGTNGKPWIFNVLGGNERHVVVTGGKFVTDVNHQFWANEVYVPKELALQSNKAESDTIWTVTEAVVYVTERGTSSNSHDRNVGYASMADAIAINKEKAEVTYNMLKPAELDKNWEIANKSIIVGNGFTVAEGFEIVLSKAEATLTAPAGLNVTSGVNAYVVSYADGTYKLEAQVAQNVDTGAYYNDVQVALNEAAAEGDTVILVNDAEAGMLMVTAGVTLDLNGKSLTADYLAAFNTSDVIDSTTGKTGKLIIDQNKVVLASDNSQMPIWNGNHYVFDDIIMQGMHNGTTNDRIKIMFRPSFTVYNKLFTDGMDNNDLKIIVRLSWIDDDGRTRTQDFVYTEDLIKRIYTNGTVFTFEASGLSEYVDMKANYMVVSNLKVEMVSGDYPLDANS